MHTLKVWIVLFLLLSTQAAPSAGNHQTQQLQVEPSWFTTFGTVLSMGLAIAGPTYFLFGSLDSEPPTMVSQPTPANNISNLVCLWTEGKNNNVTTTTPTTLEQTTPLSLQMEDHPDEDTTFQTTMALPIGNYTNNNNHTMVEQTRQQLPQVHQGSFFSMENSCLYQFLSCLGGTHSSPPQAISFSNWGAQSSAMQTGFPPLSFSLRNLLDSDTKGMFIHFDDNNNLALPHLKFDNNVLVLAIFLHDGSHLSNVASGHATVVQTNQLHTYNDLYPLHPQEYEEEEVCTDEDGEGKPLDYKEEEVCTDEDEEEDKPVASPSSKPSELKLNTPTTATPAPTETSMSTPTPTPKATPNPILTQAQLQLLTQLQMRSRAGALSFLRPPPHSAPRLLDHLMNPFLTLFEYLDGMFPDFQALVYVLYIAILSCAFVLLERTIFLLILLVRELIVYLKEIERGHIKIFFFILRLLLVRCLFNFGRPYPPSSFSSSTPMTTLDLFYQHLLCQSWTDLWRWFLLMKDYLCRRQQQKRHRRWQEYYNSYHGYTPNY